MAQIALTGGRLVAATEHLLRLSQLEPFDSHVHQMLIEVCLRRGRRTEALRHYDALRADVLALDPAIFYLGDVGAAATAAS